MPLKGDPDWLSFLDFRDKIAMDKKYVLVGMDDGMPIRELTDNETVRAANGRFFTDEEQSQFHNIDRDRKPTYGTCKGCLCCGPVGQFCIVCDDGHCYWAFRAQHVTGKILDAENLARILDVPTHPAKTDLKIRWVRTPLEITSSKRFIDYVETHFTGQEQDDKRREIIQLFQDSA